MAITVLLVDDHRMLREGLRAVLNRECDFEVVGEAGNGLDALKRVAQQRPQVVVMDVSMRDMNGIEATRRIIARYPKIRIVALSAYSDKRYVMEMLGAGALGYVLKETAADELCRAIRAVTQNRQYVSAEIADTLADGYDSLPGSGTCELTERERQVLQLLAEGRSSPMIADRLSISTRTVDAHRRNIMMKLNLFSIAELTKYAVREGLTFHH
jgi:DNA-binding NarL/FixJ family response regulator